MQRNFIVDPLSVREMSQVVAPSQPIRVTRRCEATQLADIVGASDDAGRYAR